jgi:MFS family permease
MTATALAARPALVSRPLLIRFASILGSATSFYLLLSVVPRYARAVGAGGTGAGVVTAALMLTTVAGELATPRLVARLGYRAVVAAGLVLLGAPALVLVVPAGLPVITAVSLVRGLGFAVTTVAGGALTAALIPPSRRGEGLALVGVVAGVPSIVALPAGVWLADHAGYPAVFVAAAVAALVAIASVVALPASSAARGSGAVREDGVVAGLRDPGLVRPSVVFGATAMAAGIVVTFLPLASTGPVTLALLLQSAAATAARWVAGRRGDRRGVARMLVPGLVTTSLGVVLLGVAAALPGLAAVPLLAGATLFGAGFGISQNASLALMYAHVDSGRYGTVSALWNVAYDAGMGLGAAGFGATAAHTGQPVAFGLTAAAMLVTLPLARVRAKSPAKSFSS